jgi:hypothetical protein
MSYRPITDIWFLARAKLKEGKKYYGAYLGGFPERARVLLGAGPYDPVLHVCGGMAKYYPYKGGFGQYDYTLDIDESTNPDFLQDARNPFPPRMLCYPESQRNPSQQWKAILMDPPYSEQDADKYNCGSSVYPTPNQLIKNALDVLAVGGRVGLIHYALPAQPKNAKFVAAVGVLCGFNNRIRVFSVFQKK